jgi:C4-dicarboxylate transporter DctQ subunit
LDSYKRATTEWLRRRAEQVLSALLGVMFIAFLVQIVFRYLFNWPTGWSSELTVICWLWMVLWGSAFVLREDEEIRLDLAPAIFGARARRAAAMTVALAVIVFYGLSLPASYDYVTFMKVERSAYLGIRLDFLYSIYLLFLLASIARYAALLWRAVRGGDGAQKSHRSAT